PTGIAYPVRGDPAGRQRWWLRYVRKNVEASGSPTRWASSGDGLSHHPGRDQWFLVAVPRRLAEEIDLCQIDDLVAAPAEDRLEHEEAEAGHLLEGDRRRH